jgi:hypothetical protein
MAGEVINLTARNGSIEITSGNHFEDDDFYVEATGALKVGESTDDVTVNVTPDEGYAFDHIEVDGDNLGNGYVSVDDNSGVATFHIRGRDEDAGSNYYGNTIVAVCDMAATPAPDEPTPDAQTYGRYVEINGTTGISGKRQDLCEFHLKGGFSGEKAVIDGVSYYVVDVTENYGWHTYERENENPLPNTVVRKYQEPICLIDDGKCYFKSRTTTNPDEMFLYINGMWVSVGYVALAFGVTRGNYTIEYSGNDITPAELVAQKVDEYSVRMSSMMSRLSAVLTERNGLRKAGKVLSSIDIAYKSMVDSIRDMLQ